MMKMFNVDSSESESKFDHAFKSLGGAPDRLTRGKKRTRDDSTPREKSSKHRTGSPSTPLPSDRDSDSDETDEMDKTMAGSEPGPSTGPPR